MISQKKSILLSSLLFLCTTSFATVGGGQTLEFLGYEPRDQKVYLLRHFEDGRGRLPQLYYYDFKNKSSDNAIEVTSIYLDPKTGIVDHDGNVVRFNRELKKITRRLKPLFPINSNVFHIDIHKMDQTLAASWYDSEQTIPEYRYEYHIKDHSHQSKMHQAISYKTGLTVKQAYRIPRHNIIITTVEYLAFPEETGYSTEDPVLLFPK